MDSFTFQFGFFIYHFNQVSVKEEFLEWNEWLRVEFTSYKILFFSFKNANVEMKVGIVTAIN